MDKLKNIIEQGKAILGIELGSTRIKAVLIDPTTSLTIATGGHDWENKLENGIWTYHLDDVAAGFADSYLNLKNNVLKKFGLTLTKVGAIGVSAMMHGYLAFDKQNNLLTPFRTWRNTIARDASAKLTDAFQFNIPERWSIAHLYQSVQAKDEHVKNLDFFTTLAGYIHWKLTGCKVLGVGDASGMFPIDSQINSFNEDYIKIFNDLCKKDGFDLDLSSLLPKVLVAGDDAGTLTKEGALFLDPQGDLQPGIPLCAPEGDAGTGMVATNSVGVRTGNVSAGTSIFAMIVLEKALKKLHREIDNVTTPVGSQVAMVHANNCTSDLNAWVGLFDDFAKSAGLNLSPDELFGLLYNKALKATPDCDGIVSYGYYSGEFITKLEEGRPLMLRTPNSEFNVGNLMRSNLNSSLGAIRLGMNILTDEEQVKIDKLLGHGGLFKTPVVGQTIMADALNTPVWVMETAGEGGSWGMAVLANYLINKDNGETLPDFLDNKVFKDSKGVKITPDKEGVDGFNEYIKNYVSCLKVEQAAVDSLKAK